MTGGEAVHHEVPMRRLSTKYPFTCVTCEAEIAGQAVFHLGLPFCCSGCAADGPCNCSYDEGAPDGERAGYTSAFDPAALADDKAGLANTRRAVLSVE